MIDLFNKKYKNLKRYREILSVFYKYGLDSYLSGINEKNIVRRWLFKSKRLNLREGISRGERLKLAIEELGPTFVKLGQILSTRYDMLPRDIVDSLSELQDNVNEFSLEEAEAIFKSETGNDLRRSFDSFYEKPIAAASIGQVYRARLKSGQDVVIKIQRPNIEKTIVTDIDILMRMSTLVDESLNKNGVFKAADIVKEFGYYLNKEIDYIYEAQNALKFASNFKSRRAVRIPSIYWEYTTSKILVMDEIKGIKISEIEKLNSENWNLKKISKNLAESFMTQIFMHGLFHGDPHPGNIMVIDEETLGFIDFGIVGFVDSATKKFIVSMLKASQDGNMDLIVELLLQIGSASEGINEEELKKDIYFILSHYFDMPIDRIDFSEAMKEIFKTAFKHRLKLPSQLSLLMKASITIEGCIRELEPGFSIEDISKDMVRQIYIDKLGLRKSWADIVKWGYEISESVEKIPRRVNKIVENLEKNRLRLNLSYENEKRTIGELHNISRRLTFGILTGSLIISSTFILGDSAGIYGKIIRYIAMATFGGSFLIGNIYMWKHIFKKK